PRILHRLCPAGLDGPGGGPAAAAAAPGGHPGLRLPVAGRGGRPAMMTAATAALIPPPGPSYGFTRPEIETILRPYYERGARLVRLALLVHFAIALALAPFYQTWLLTLPVASAAVAMFLLSAALAPCSFLTRVVAGVSLQVFVALHIYQLHGLPEMHFFF